MLTFAKARAIAEVWVSAITDGTAELIRESTIAKSYGWIFFYQSSDFVRDPSNISAMLAGNGPFLVDRNSGEVRVFGTASPLSTQLSEYELTLPPAQKVGKVEQPKWEAA
jgi:Immunity protein 35